MGLVEKIKVWWLNIRYKRYYKFSKGDVMIDMKNVDPERFYVIRELDFMNKEYIIESSITRYWLRQDKVAFENNFTKSVAHNSTLFKRLNIDIFRKK